jgi:hypothetical protein
MVTLRRMLSLGALLFWQGGFTFYAAVVVPITRQVLRDHGRLPLAALITGQATGWLNWAGVIGLAFLLWDLAAVGDASRRRMRLRCAAWAVLFLTLAGLFLVHYLLDRLGPLDGIAPADQSTFWAMHSIYLAASTLQWVAALAFLGLALSAWRAQDQGKPISEPMNPRPQMAYGAQDSTGVVPGVRDGLREETR